MARLFVAKQVEAPWVTGHNKGVLCWSYLFLPKESTGSRDTLLLHNAVILADVYEAALQILTLQDVPIDGSEKKGETYSPTHERGIWNSMAENSSSARLSWKSSHHVNLSPIDFPSL